MPILVCPLSRVREMVEAHAPALVISLLDPDSPFPDLGESFQQRHLRNPVHDICLPQPGLVVPAATHVRTLLRFLTTWDRGQPLLIHCQAGISRSTATAYIAACFAHPDQDEYQLALALRRTAPLARPNSTIVALADDEMGREGRMIAAIERTGKDLTWPGVEEGESFTFSLP
jgi:predicted protein tyrosine phosphatase